MFKKWWNIFYRKNTKIVVFYSRPRHGVCFVNVDGFLPKWKFRFVMGVLKEFFGVSSINLKGPFYNKEYGYNLYTGKVL